MQSQDEQAQLLAPWIGDDLPLDALPLPVTIAVSLQGDGPDVDDLALRLAADAPDADSAAVGAAAVAAAAGAAAVASAAEATVDAAAAT